MHSINTNIGALVALRNLQAQHDATDRLTGDPRHTVVHVIDAPEPEPLALFVEVGNGHGRQGSKKYAPRGGAYMPHQGKKERLRRLRQAARGR